MHYTFSFLFSSCYFVNDADNKLFFILMLCGLSSSTEEEKPMDKKVNLPSCHHLFSINKSFNK